MNVYLGRCLIVCVLMNCLIQVCRNADENFSRDIDRQLSGTCFQRTRNCTPNDVFKIDMLSRSVRAGSDNRHTGWKTVDEISADLTPRLTPDCQPDARRYILHQMAVENNGKLLCESFRRYAEPPVSGLSALCTDKDRAKVKKIMCGSSHTSERTSHSSYLDIKSLAQSFAEVKPLLTEACQSDAERFVVRQRSIDVGLNKERYICESYRRFAEPPVDGLSGNCTSGDKAKLKATICGGSYLDYEVWVGMPVKDIMAGIKPFLSHSCQSDAEEFMLRQASIEGNEGKLCETFKNYVEPPVAELSDSCTDDDVAKLWAITCGARAVPALATSLLLSCLLQVLVML